jgi:hypothetical protein
MMKMLTAVLCLALPIAAEVKVDADYPGGNIILEKIEGDTITLRQDIRDTKGWWFYWNFRVKGAAGRTMTIRFTDRNPIGVRGPAMSTDKGLTWKWLGRKATKGASFTYAFPAGVEEVRFCFAMPYQEADLKHFLKKHSDNKHLTVKELCKSRKKRVIERIHAGAMGAEPAYRVLLTCRNHACEMMASYVLEGLLETVLSDTENGRWFKKNVEILAIPFMDKDGVEDGDQGKNRKPRDHNRDYDAKSIYPSVKALMKLVPQWSGGKLALALDLHCPYISGKNNESIYLVGSQDKKIWAEQSRFSQLLQKAATGPLPYRASDNIPFGKAWNTTKNYKDGLSCARWAAGLEGIRCAATIEFPYANANGKEITADSSRAFGSDLARAIRAYLESKP